ncbi:hypothetical protein [uncultured Corynebacterium sp.]|uniref:hypothetical protein n=1 Tax=uncultured Corynebacterium sp. TaxID=159447 RepID=UPI0025F8E94F|nr:hypothetical protein [uncultured Corynebacterium sp.]
MVKPWRTRILGMCSASAVACAVGILPATLTETGHQGPTAQAAESTQWTNPSARDGHSKNDIDVSIFQINPTIATIDGHVAFTVKLTNSTSSTLDSITYSLSRSDAVVDTASARLRLADNKDVFNHDLINGSVDHDQANDSQSTGSTSARESGKKSTSAKNSKSTAASSDNSSVTLKPGESTILTFDLPITDGNGKATPLGITGPGTYPIVISAQAGSYEGSSRFLLPVRDKANSDTDNKPATENQPVPLTFLWPLASRSAIVPGETGEAPDSAPLLLSDETLAHELARGGRLDGLLSAYANAANKNSGLKEASCLAIDPDLLTTVERMTHGYSVTKERPSAVSETTRLRDSWGSSQGTTTRDGKGTDDAERWLKKLKDTASGGCVVSLPTSGANLNAVAATKDPWLAAQTLSTGDTTIQAILGTSTLSNIAIPGAGYLNQDAIPSLANAYTNGEPVDLNSQFEEGVTNTDKSADAPTTEEPQVNPVTLTSDDASSNTVRPASWPPQDPHLTTLVADNSLSTSPDSDNGDKSGTAPSDGSSSDNANSAGRDSASRSRDDGSAAPDQSGWGNKLIDVGHGVTAIPFNADVGATLAATGGTPETAAYATPLTRYHETLDSSHARMQDAIAVMWQTIQSRTPVLATPPAQWTASSDDATAFLDAVAAIIGGGDATPTALSAITSQTPHSTGSVNRPYDDPGAVNSDDIHRVAAQASSITRLTTMMSNDDRIELTRFNFTAPLRTDLLRALTDDGRRSEKKYDTVTQYSDTLLDKSQAMLHNLLTSVKLVPPGNVYTRTSDSSPILIVARNGLPLPVKASLQWQGPSNVQLAELKQTLPARGSVTLQVHADIAARSKQTKLKLWLAGDHNQALSEPTTVAIQSAPGISWKGVLTVSGILVTIAGIGLILRERRTRM